ncbi:MAG: DegT/DnrJ/EryC1/StrS family aminotransferase [Bradymonadaceae bacterium]
MTDPIYLSPPHIGELEEQYVREAFETNWIAPLGPNVDAFEREFADYVGAGHALALNSGTSALHLAMIEAGVEPGDEVFVSTLTFVASANVVAYEGATPVFVDCDRETWNMDSDLLERALEERAARGALPEAVMVVHMCGQCADLDPIVEVCDRFDVTLVEDAAEALGATYKGEAPGTFGEMGAFSFNGNKIITTSGGGMLVADDEAVIEHARKLSTQARDDAPHYEHTEIGYNYRLSNLLAGVGRGQLRLLDERVEQTYAVHDFYREALGDLPGVDFMPEADYGDSTRWLTCLTVEPEAAGVTSDEIREALQAENIDARPIWKPMHMQPVYEDCEVIGGEVAEALFDKGLSLPSGSNLSEEDLARITGIVRNCFP